MNTDKTIVVLVNNLEYFKFMCDHFPKNINDFYFVAINEQRIGDKTKEIQKILEDSICNSFKVFGSDLILEKFKSEVINVPFVDSYTMGMNILQIWFVFKYLKGVDKVLTLDDDVILGCGEKLAGLFEEEHCHFQHCRLSAGLVDYDKNSENAKKVYESWWKCYDITWSEEFWKEYLFKYANSGQIFIVKDEFDLERYEEQLKKFFQDETFEHFWNERRTHCSWYFDERFLTLFFFDKLNNELQRKKYSKLLLNKEDKFTETSLAKTVRSTAIVHVACNSHKKKVYEKIERGLKNV